MQYQEDDIRPNYQRARLAMIMIWVVLGLDFISLALDYNQLDLLRTAAAGEYVSMEAAELNDRVQQIFAGVYLLVYIACAVTFIQWFRRAYYNIQLISPNLSFTEGWAAGSWFVPIINLFRPYQIMKEMYVEANRLLEDRYESFIRARTSMLIVWWSLWIITGIVGRYVLSSSIKAETLSEITSFTIANMIASSLGILLAIVAVKVIRDYAALEELLYQPDNSNADASAETVSGSVA